MKKLNLLLLGIFSISVYCQNKDCLKLSNEIIELKTQNDYYKESLKLLEPKKIVNVDGLEFNLIKLVGNRKNKTLTATIIYKNIDTETRSDYQPIEAYLTDIQGNNFSTYEINVGARGIRIENIKPKIPIKQTIVFKLNEADLPIIKLLYFNFSSKDISNSKLQIVEFENIDIDWE